EHHRHALFESKGPWEIVELGPGDGQKARLLLEALASRQSRARFIAVDVSAQALGDCRRTLRELEGVQVHCIEDTFLEGLTRGVAEREGETRLLVLFLGSNLSNFDREEA